MRLIPRSLITLSQAQIVGMPRLIERNRDPRPDSFALDTLSLRTNSEDHPCSSSSSSWHSWTYLQRALVRLPSRCRPRLHLPRHWRHRHSSPVSISRVSTAASGRRMICTGSRRHLAREHAEIPADRSNYGSFIILDDKAQEEVKQLDRRRVRAAEPPTGLGRAEGRRLSTSLTWTPRASRASGSLRSRRTRAASTRSRRRATWRVTSATRSASAVAPAIRLVLVARQQELVGLSGRRCTRTGSPCPTAITT